MDGDCGFTRMPQDKTNYEDSKRSVIRVCRGLTDRGLMGPLSSGNVSSMSRGQLNITAKGMPLSDVQEESDLAWVLAGLSGEREFSTETHLHKAIYHWDIDASIVVHIHSPWVVAASCLSYEYLPALHYHVALISPVGLVPYVEYHTPGSEELVEALMSCLQSYKPSEASALILSNHGALVWGTTDAQVLSRCEALEDCCRLVVQVPKPRHSLLPSQIQAAAQMFQNYGNRDD